MICLDLPLTARKSFCFMQGMYHSSQKKQIWAGSYLYGGGGPLCVRLLKLIGDFLGSLTSLQAAEPWLSDSLCALRITSKLQHYHQLGVNDFKYCKWLQYYMSGTSTARNPSDLSPILYFPSIFPGCRFCIILKGFTVKLHVLLFSRPQAQNTHFQLLALVPFVTCCRTKIICSSVPPKVFLLHYPLRNPHGLPDVHAGYHWRCPARCHVPLHQLHNGKHSE